MSKTIKNVFQNNLTFEKLLEAHKRAKKNKGNRPEIIRFEMDLESNISNLLYKIKNNTYHMGKYREFYVYEPKERLIKSLPYVDRVVHQWYVEEFIKPHFLPKFIKDSYACLENKGCHEAKKRVQYFMRQMKKKYGKYYILKCDIKKYFYNIDKNILFKILEKNIKDKKLLNFTYILIFDSEEEKGIPIGNYTSQFFANIYLNELDHFIKEKLRVKYYIRYMDDFLLLVPTKEEAKEYLNIISKFLKDNLDLELNIKSKYYPSKMCVDYCGYRIFETHILVRNRCKKKIKKIIKKWNYLYENNLINLFFVRQSWNSWKGHISHANSYNLKNRYIEKIKFSDYL